jgi:tetratricopeptide (TPR) repeat protein
MGRAGEAEEVMSLAMNLDPASDAIAATAGFVAYMSRDFERAESLLTSLVEKSPRFAMGYFYLGWLDILGGKFEDAAGKFRWALSLAGGDPRIRAWLGYALWKSGDTEGGDAVHKELEELSTTRYVDPAFIALLHLGMGETGQALDWLEKGYEGHSFWMAWLKADPFLDPLRGEPRFNDLLERLNFPD